MLNGFEDKSIFDEFQNITILPNNQACIQDAVHPVMSNLSKHINFKCLQIINHTRTKTGKICYLKTDKTENMAADVMTRALILTTFWYHIKRWGMD